MNKKTKKKTKKIDRQWLPNFSELIDRLTIHQLKEVFISEHKDKYRSEMKKIIHDLDQMIQNDNIPFSGELVRVIIIVAQINAHIWYNESKARNGETHDSQLLQLTHGLNGIRNNAGNRLLELGNDEGRKDYKVDCLAAEHSQWDISLNLD